MGRESRGGGTESLYILYSTAKQVLCFYPETSVHVPLGPRKGQIRIKGSQVNNTFSGKSSLIHVFVFVLLLFFK